MWKPGAVDACLCARDPTSCVDKSSAQRNVVGGYTSCLCGYDVELFCLLSWQVHNCIPSEYESVQPTPCHLFFRSARSA